MYMKLKSAQYLFRWSNITVNYNRTMFQDDSLHCVFFRVYILICNPIIDIPRDI